MSELPVNANIVEKGGPYYQVRLQWVPRVGELIDLHSFLEQARGIKEGDGDPGTRWYEVVQVVHKINDVTERFPQGAHFVTVHVVPSSSPHLNEFETV